MAQGKNPEKQESRTAKVVRFDIDAKSPILWGFLVVLFVLPLILYLTNVLAEGTAGAILFTSFVLVLNALSLRGIWNSTPHRTPRVISVVLLLAVTALALEPGLSTVYPGRPLAAGSLHNVGESFPLPGDLEGRVRLLLHGDLGQRQLANVDVVLSVGDNDIKGHLARSVSRGRRGRFRGGSQVVEQSSEYLTAFVPKGSPSLLLSSVDGSMPEVLEVKLFREWIPLGVVIALGLLVLVSLSLLAARLRVDGTPTTLASMALSAGLILYVSATPDNSVTPEIGVLFLTVVVGMALGASLAWMGRKLASPRV